jgi:hypothetical protein
MWSGNYYEEEASLLDQSGIEAVGQIVSMKEYNDEDGKFYEAHLDYQDLYQVKYTVVFTYHAKPTFQVGDEVEIIYSPKRTTFVAMKLDKRRGTHLRDRDW